MDVDVALNGIDFAPGVRFTYFGIEHVAPTRGPAAGGTRVRLRGAALHTGHAAATPVSAPSCRFGNVQVPASMANDTADLLCIAPTPASGAGTVALALALALGLDGAPEYRGAPSRVCSLQRLACMCSLQRAGVPRRAQLVVLCASVGPAHLPFVGEPRGRRLACMCSIQRIFPSLGSRGGGALVHVYGTALSTALVPADADAVMDETYVPDETYVHDET